MNIEGKKINNTKPKSPERLSGHDLVKYLLDNPGAQGNFKWHTLRSCMWHDLLTVRPEFETAADFEKITPRDAFKILNAQPALADRFDWSKLTRDENLQLMIRYPELATPARTAAFNGYFWSELLKRRPELSDLCPFKKLYASDWINLLRRQKSFSDQCPWEKLSAYYDWANLLSEKNEYLSFLKLEYMNCRDNYHGILANCYFGKTQSYAGMFRQDVEDAATFLIYKRLDRTNAKRYLKKQYSNANWEFVAKVCELSPADALDVYGGKHMPFFITLMAPDDVFEKLYPVFDKKMRDSGGNSLLLPALIRGLVESPDCRYHKLLADGFDPDEKNIAGFSCNDTLEYFRNKPLKGKRYGR